MHAFPRDHYNSSTSDLFIHYYQTVQGSTNRDRIRGDFGKQTMTSYHRTIHFRCHWTHLLPMKTFYFSFYFLHNYGYLDRADLFGSTHRILRSVWTWNSLKFLKIAYVWLLHASSFYCPSSDGVCLSCGLFNHHVIVLYLFYKCLLYYANSDVIV